MSSSAGSHKATHNLCNRCQRSCKQIASVHLLECRRYLPVPVQLEFKFHKNGNKKKP